MLPEVSLLRTAKARCRASHDQALAEAIKAVTPIDWLSASGYTISQSDRRTLSVRQPASWRVEHDGRGRRVDQVNRNQVRGRRSLRAGLADVANRDAQFVGDSLPGVASGAKLKRCGDQAATKLWRISGTTTPADGAYVLAKCSEVGQHGDSLEVREGYAWSMRSSSRRARRGKTVLGVCRLRHDGHGEEIP